MSGETLQEGMSIANVLYVELQTRWSFHGEVCNITVQYNWRLRSRQIRSPRPGDHRSLQCWCRRLLLWIVCRFNAPCHRSSLRFVTLAKRIVSVSFLLKKHKNKRCRYCCHFITERK